MTTVRPKRYGPAGRRPHVPVAIQLQVAMRQLGTSSRIAGLSDGKQLRVCLAILGLIKPHLDHDPPLAKREFNERTQRYTPCACHPDHLQWLEGSTGVDGGHHEKTHGRGGEKMRFGGDLREIRKLKRLEKEPDKWRNVGQKKRSRQKVTRRKQKFPSRPLRSRSSFGSTRS